MNATEIPIIIPSILEEPELQGLAERLSLSAGISNRVIISCSLNSASVNRNNGMRLAKDSEIIVMVDDDISPLRDGWLEVLVRYLKQPDVVMVSSQLYKDNKGNYAYMTGIQDWGASPKDTGATIVPTKRLLTACCAFKTYGALFDEGFIGSGFEDIDFCNQLAELRPNDKFLVCHDSHVIHYNEMRHQRGEIWVHNKKYYESKWGRVPRMKGLKREEYKLP